MLANKREYAMTRRTPADLTIRPRNLAFHREGGKPRWWAGGDPIATAFYNALSATFPKGERFFMDSVRHYKDAADETLSKEIAAFIAQEAVHSREHVAFNKQVTAHGYSIAGIEAMHDKMLAEAAERHPIARLASTMAMEHFTAIIAHQLLANPAHLAGAPEETADLWRWHAMEEIEHKAVAFDTYMAAMKDAGAWKRWKIRSIVMVHSTIRFVRLVGFGMGDLLAQDGIALGKRKRDLAGFLLVQPGMVRALLAGYLKFFLPGFHPWAEDDRALIAPLQASFEEQGALAA
ncbi:MAG: metal-dependent hydrolase [Caulobacteraceae bacterium]